MIETPTITSTENERQHADFDRRAPLEETILRRLYSYMLKSRTVEERIRLLFRQGRFSGNYFAAVGQEATEVGATMDLLPEGPESCDKKSWFLDRLLVKHGKPDWTFEPGYPLIDRNILYEQKIDVVTGKHSSGLYH